MILAPNVFGGGPPECLDLYYKIHPYCDRVAKFHGDRSRELGGSPAKEKNTGKTYARFFRSSMRRGRHGPSGPIVNTPLMSERGVNSTIILKN